MINSFDDEIIAFVVGNGAGSKYVHSLLDSHPEIYMMPGYSLMYFYPHFKKTCKTAKNKRSFINTILDRMPGIYDTTLMPGSETLNMLGKDGDQFLKVKKNLILEFIISYLSKEEFNSKNLLLAIHEAHFNFFGKRYYLKKPTKILYHIHDHFYLDELKMDFQKLKLISMTRRPSLNIARRIRSGVLEADRDKLDNLDFIFVQLQSSSKAAYYHYEFKKICSKLKIVPFFIKYDLLIKDETSVINNTLIKLGFSPFIGPLVPTFGGYLHKLRFYEKHRGTSLKEIRSKALEELNIKETNLDRIYDCYVQRRNLKSFLLLKGILEVLIPTSYELDLVLRIFSPKFIVYFFLNLFKIITEKPMIYNMNHGYFIFKWSTPISFIKLNMFLKQKQLGYQLSDNYTFIFLVKILRITNYFLSTIFSYIFYPVRILLRILYQINTINIIRKNNL